MGWAECVAVVELGVESVEERGKGSGGNGLAWYGIPWVHAFSLVGVPVYFYLPYSPLF